MTYKHEYILEGGESFIAVRRALETFSKQEDQNPELKRKIGYIVRQLKYKGRYIESDAGFLVVCVKIGTRYKITIYEE